MLSRPKKNRRACAESILLRPGMPGIVIARQGRNSLGPRFGGARRWVLGNYVYSRGQKWHSIALRSKKGETQHRSGFRHGADAPDGKVALPEMDGVTAYASEKPPWIVGSTQTKKNTNGAGSLKKRQKACEPSRQY